MSDILPTVRVVNPAAPGEFKIINASDMKPHHVLWSDGAAETPPAALGDDQTHNPSDKADDDAPAALPASPSVPQSPPAPRDPLDHDGDGRKGGSLPHVKAGKGPGGRWYVKQGKEIVSGPYPDEGAALAAAEKENTL